MRRDEDPADRRRVILSVTARGMRVLDTLSESHARELGEFAPRLVRALENIEAVRAEFPRRGESPGLKSRQFMCHLPRAKARCYSETMISKHLIRT